MIYRYKNVTLLLLTCGKLEKHPDPRVSRSGKRQQRHHRQSRYRESSGPITIYIRVFVGRRPRLIGQQHLGDMRVEHQVDHH